MFSQILSAIVASVASVAGLLKFSPANTKIRRLYDNPALAPYLGDQTPRKRGRKQIYSLDLLAGVTCPGGGDCAACADYSDPNHPKVVDGPNAKFRCFAAMTETQYRDVYKLHLHNTTQLARCRTTRQIYDLIVASLPSNVGVVRVNAAGDYFSAKYMEAIFQVALDHPNILFYFYTKSLPILAKLLKKYKPLDPPNGVIFDNLLCTVSIGGKFDHLNRGLGFRTATVLTTREQVEFAKQNSAVYPLNWDEWPAATRGGSFYLALHGVQPVGKWQPNGDKAKATREAKQTN